MRHRSKTVQTAADTANPLDWLFKTPSDGIFEAQQAEERRKNVQENIQVILSCTNFFVYCLFFCIPIFIFATDVPGEIVAWGFCLFFDFVAVFILISMHATDRCAGKHEDMCTR